MLVTLNPKPYTARIEVTPIGWYRDDEDRFGRVGAIVDAVARAGGVTRIEADEALVIVDVPIEQGVDLAALRARVRRVAEDAYALWLAERLFVRGVRELLGEGGDAERLERLRKALTTSTAKAP